MTISSGDNSYTTHWHIRLSSRFVIWRIFWIPFSFGQILVTHSPLLANTNHPQFKTKVYEDYEPNKKFNCCKIWISKRYIDIIKVYYLREWQNQVQGLKKCKLVRNIQGVPKQMMHPELNKDGSWKDDLLLSAIDTYRVILLLEHLF